MLLGWPHCRGAALGMGSRENEQNSSVLLVNSDRQSWFLTSKEIWGAEFCRVLWESQSQSLSEVHSIFSRDNSKGSACFLFQPALACGLSFTFTEAP